MRVLLTPTIREQRVLWVRAATFPRRLAAAAVDLVIVGGVSAIVTMLAATAQKIRRTLTSNWRGDK